MRPYWQNPEIQQLGRLPMRSPLLPFDSKERAITAAARGCEHCSSPETPWFQSLNGRWQFTLMDAPELDGNGAPFAGWQQPDYDDSAWKPLTVPLTWTLQGYDKPHYTNVQMPFSATPPYTPAANPTGLHRLRVAVSQSWRGRRIVLHVGSAESCLLAYVNGAFVGLSKDSRLPAEFDITDEVRWNADGAGDALIALKVVRYSDASFLEDQDQWWFGGIHRDVYLYSTEQTYIADVEALTSVRARNGKTEGAVSLTVQLGYAARAGETPQKPVLDALCRTVSYALYELDDCTGENPHAGALVANGSTTLCYDYRLNEAKARAELTVDSPKLWSSERPALYVLRVSLYEGAPTTEATTGTAPRLIESTACTIGFKSVVIENRELRINGKRVYLHGVNRHEHSDRTGKTLTLAQMKRDIVLLKQHNFNAVRTCHYPDDERWYDLCDRYGIYVMDEANIENHAYYDVFCRSDEWTGAYMLRVQRMFRRDKNHACIFSWSLGNESGAAQNQDAQAAWLHRADPTRVVHYEGYSRPEFRQAGYTMESLARGRGVVDLVSPMYPDIPTIVRFADTVDDPRPLIMCEYSHAMGNANGSLADYWRAIEAHHGLQGGFIWDWIDQGIAAESADGHAYWKYGGDFGDAPTDYDFCLNGLLFPDQTPKPAMEECRHLFAPVRLYAVNAAQGRFEVENCFDFTMLDALSARWTLLLNGSQIGCGELSLPALAPDARAPLQFPIAAVLEAAVTRGARTDGEFVLRVDFVYAQPTPFADAGTLCCRSATVFGGPARVTPAVAQWGMAARMCDSTDAPSQHDAAAAVVTPTQFAALARPQLFRALVENECIKAHRAELEERAHHFACRATVEWLHADLLHLTADKSGTLWTGANASADLRGKRLGTFTKTAAPFVTKDGAHGVLLDLHVSLNDTLSEYPRAGITLPVSASFTSATWYGCGAHEAYSDRATSACLGTYTLPVTALETPYIVPQENGNRYDVRLLTLHGTDGRRLHIAAENGSSFSFSLLRHTVADLWQTHHTAELTDTAARGFYTLNIDLAQRGVGTAACGPDTLEQYRVYPGSYQLRLYVWETTEAHTE